MFLKHPECEVMSIEADSCLLLIMNSDVWLTMGS